MLCVKNVYLQFVLQNLNLMAKRCFFFITYFLNLNSLGKINRFNISVGLLYIISKETI